MSCVDTSHSRHKGWQQRRPITPQIVSEAMGGEGWRRVLKIVKGDGDEGKHFSLTC